MKRPRWREPQGRNLRLLRESANLNQRALAQRVGGVTVDTVRNWEQGKNQPYPEHLEALARVFEVDVDRLFAPVAMLIPKFDVGLHLFCAPPVLARETLVVEPILRKLRSLPLEFYRVDDFGLTELRAELDALVGVTRGDRNKAEYKAQLVAWAKAKPRALVLSAFHPLDDSDWVDYIDYVKWLKDDSCIVVVQIIDPFHVQAVLTSSSRYAATAHPIEMEFDSEPSANDLRRELPGCCRRTIADILSGRCEGIDGRECVAKLIDARIVSRSDGLFLFSGSDDLWRRTVEI